LTKVEIVRKIKSEFLLDRTLIEKIWKSFVLDVNCTEIEVNIPVSELYREILEIVSSIPIRKRVTNLEHLIIAKKKNLIFVTGDEEVLEKCKEFYPRIWSYKDLRRFYSNLSIR
jgi:predicted nucleic acid-binding protein